MELCDITLQDFIAGNRGPIQKTTALELDDKTTSRDPHALKWHEVCKIMKHILKGLVFIHESREIHRDLKPSNSIYSNCYSNSSPLF
jgi:serine/threonine protein kinase